MIEIDSVTSAFDAANKAKVSTAYSFTAYFRLYFLADRTAACSMIGC